MAITGRLEESSEQTLFASLEGGWGQLPATFENGQSTHRNGDKESERRKHAKAGEAAFK